MEIDKVFSLYDRGISGLAPSTGALISLILLIFLIWQIYSIIKSGHWIFIVALIIFLPGTWPAARHIADLIWKMIKFLTTRAQIIFS